MKFHLLLLPLCFVVGAEEPALPVADRAAIEKIYHDHRTGTKPPFEQAMPPTLLEQLVQADRRKESALRQVYGVEVTPGLVEAEVQRINATTRAPEMLAEIKHALGDDPARFAQSMVRPIVVERILRQRFDNDDTLHAPQRAAADKARQALLAKVAVEGMQDSTWELTPRPAEENTTPPTPPAEGDKTPVRSTSGSYSNEATAQVAQVLGGGQEKPGDRKLYFEDLDLELQNVLRAQLQKPGDVSAVIEIPAGFLVFLAKEKSSSALTASCLTIPKRSYDEWIAQQPVPSP
jgi:hypothetical protein